MNYRALDLFCGAGGASMGLHRAGFEVVGVDHRPQPNYPFTCVQADALSPPFNLSGFDFIWASPPCQHASVGAKRWLTEGREYPNHIPATRKLLKHSGALTVIENVPGADIRRDLILTGEMFGLKTHRRRHFETSWFCLQPARPDRKGPKTAEGWVTLAGHGGDGPNRLDAWCEAVAIDWMTKAELAQAIPPAYAEFIGRAAIKELQHRRAA